MSRPDAGQRQAGYHPCPVTLPGGAECGILIPRHLLMHDAHWRMVSRATQRAVYAAWGGGRYPQGRQAHADACRAAIEEAEAVLLEAAAAPARTRRY